MFLQMDTECCCIKEKEPWKSLLEGHKSLTKRIASKKRT